MNLDDLWIGDKVFLKSKEENGLYEGRADANQVWVKFNNEKLKVPIADLAPAKYKKHNHKKVEIEVHTDDDYDPNEKANFNSTIDLHMHILAPERKPNPYIPVIEFQKQQCRNFIEKAFNLNIDRVEIIHGKGEGKLKAAVKLLLMDFSEVNLVNEISDGGALEIWFKGGWKK